MAMKVEIKGISKVIGNMKQLEKGIPLQAAAALYQEALLIQKVSMSRTPVDQRKRGSGGGTLRDSHETSAPYWKGKFLRVDIEVGGPAEKYAIVQHEEMTFKHKVGQAKFLESAFNEAEAGMMARIAKRIKLNRGVS
jgi:hypothetical protein